MSHVTTSPQTPLKRLREKRDQTIRQVASALNIAERTYIRWEQGDGLPDAENLIRIADYFRVHPRDLVPSESRATAAK
jgi:transcriptional regulator with XRE-family HTH domain